MVFFLGGDKFGGSCPQAPRGYVPGKHGHSRREHYMQLFNSQPGLRARWIKGLKGSNEYTIVLHGTPTQTELRVVTRHTTVIAQCYNLTYEYTIA